jgi:hypothetical protein
MKNIFKLRKKRKFIEGIYIIAASLILTFFFPIELTFLIAVIGLFLIFKFSPALPAFFAIFFIASWPALILLNREDIALNTGFTAYYLVSLSVVLFIIDNIISLKKSKKKRGRPRKK